MFSGLVEDVGQVTEVSERQGSRRLGIRTELAGEPNREGDSVAVNGVCLSVAELGAGQFWFDVVAETLDRSTLGRVQVGSQVNLERALRVGDRLGGHVVQGHVDCTALILDVRQSGDDYRLQVGFEPEIERLVAVKGSVTLDGVSLTVSGLDRLGFEVALVPYTLERTNLGAVRAGDRVNVEADVLARYLDRLIHLDRDGPAGSAIVPPDEDDHGR